MNPVVHYCNVESSAIIIIFICFLFEACCTLAALDAQFASHNHITLPSHDRWEDKVMALRAFKGTRGASSISIGIALLGGMSASPCLRAEKWLPVSNGATVTGET